MDIYAVNDIAKLIEGNSYVGRGIVIGKSADGKKACTAYFIMGRSANSRNRIFAERGGVLYTEPFDTSTRSRIRASLFTPQSETLKIKL